MCSPAVCLQLMQKSDTAHGVGVAAVEEAVHIAALHSHLFGNVCKGKEVLQRRVYASIAQQSHEVYLPPLLLRVSQCADKCGMLGQCTIVAGTVNLH